jgi:hypothetical protein
MQRENVVCTYRPCLSVQRASLETDIACSVSGLASVINTKKSDADVDALCRARNFLWTTRKKDLEEKSFEACQRTIRIPTRCLCTNLPVKGAQGVLKLKRGKTYIPQRKKGKKKLDATGGILLCELF